MNNQDLVILIVDDTEEDFMLINLAFHKCEFSKKVVWMPNGEKVLEYLNQESNFVDSAGRTKPLIIFLDINMPRMNGFEVLKEIRNHPSESVKKIPIIMFSSSSARNDINQGYLEGANLFITKPSTYPTLIEFVKSFTQFWMEFCAVPS